VESVYNPIQKDRATFLETAAISAGVVTHLEIELSPADGNPLHYHTAFTERFEVVSGALDVTVDGVTRRLQPGDSALVERRQVHRFFNPTNESMVFRVELRPANAGFENALRIAYRLAATAERLGKGFPGRSSISPCSARWQPRTRLALPGG
jgi:mannose-6-phosphate isomerase-like protein (cupin superfamily)